jgi:hypothetical protein
MSGTAADVRNPEKLPSDDLTLIEAMTHEPVGDPAGDGLWHMKGMQLPAYVQHIANDLHAGGMAESRAIATAVSRCKAWCAGGDNVKADTRAKACAAVAEWEALKVKAHLTSGNTHASFFNPSQHPRQPKGSPTGGEFAPGGSGTAPTSAHPVSQGSSNGAQVKHLQERLNALGYHVKADGKFGPKTLAAVRKFQTDHKLKVDGLVGPKTTAKLRSRATRHRTHTTTQTQQKQPRQKKPPAKKKPHGFFKIGAAAGLPELVTLPGVDLLAAGTWELSSGRNTFTRADIANAIDAANCPAVGAPVIKLGHQDPRFDGEPAIGRVTNLRSDDSGSKLVGDLTDMPGWLGAVAASAYPRRSVEGSYGFKCQIGHTHPFVLTGLALLGVTAPGVGVLSGLPDIASLYGIHAAAVAETFRTAPQDMEGDVVAVTEEDVRRAYYADGGAPSTWWITELQMAPTQLVVAGDDGKIFRVPFTIDSDGIVFGEAEAVDTYADLTASRGTGHLVTYASADESRDVGGESDDEGESFEAADNGGWVQRGGKWVYDPDNDGDDDSTASGDTDNSHWDSDGNMKPGVKIPPKPTKAGASDAPTLDGDYKTGDKNNESMATHGAFTGKHSHPHDANGAQGDDATHKHSHPHSGDGSHAHTHAAVNNRKDAQVEFTTEQEATLRTALGLGEDDELTPDAVLTASAALSEKAEAKVSAAGRRAKLPEGVIAVEQEVWDNINRKVEAGERFRSKVLRDERDEVIDQAVRHGKFSAARAPHWKRLWDADPEGTREVLGSLKKNTVPTSDIGAGGGNLDDEAYEQEYAALYPPGSYGKDA